MSSAPGSHLLLLSYSIITLLVQIERTNSCLPPVVEDTIYIKRFDEGKDPWNDKNSWNKLRLR